MENKTEIKNGASAPIGTDEYYNLGSNFDPLEIGSLRLKFPNNGSVDIGFYPGIMYRNDGTLKIFDVTIDQVHFSGVYSQISIHGSGVMGFMVEADQINPGAMYPSFLTMIHGSAIALKEKEMKDGSKALKIYVREA